MTEQKHTYITIHILNKIILQIVIIIIFTIYLSYIITCFTQLLYTMLQAARKVDW